MGGGDEIVMVNNNYKTALESARSASTSAANDLETALRAALQAVEAGAWGGPMGEDFAGELRDHKTRLNDAGPEAISTFDTAITAQPERVESTAWQVRWHSMGPR